MNSRQRWRAVANRKDVDRLPCDFWATNEVVENLCKAVGCDDYWKMCDKLNIDAPYKLAPPYIGPNLKEGCDIWGVKQRIVKYATGSYKEPVANPLARIDTVREVDNYLWPKPDWFDYSQLKAEVQQNSHRPIQAGYVEPFLIYSFMRGLEQAMVDMIVYPDLVECAFNHIFEFATTQFQRMLEVTNGDIDITVPSEDLGSQTGPLFSLQLFRRFHKGHFTKYVAMAKQADVLSFFHTDGAARDFIPDLVEIGVDILNPIQWRCPGMDRASLKADFGKHIVFHGGVENQEILPFGKPKDVRDEVIKCFETLGFGGGYICAPCHNIQPNTPVENIIEMYRTINEISADMRFTKAQSQ
jgi:uroporphyrinogen decarboxylase